MQDLGGLERTGPLLLVRTGFHGDHRALHDTPLGLRTLLQLQGLGEPRLPLDELSRQRLDYLLFGLEAADSRQRQVDRCPDTQADPQHALGPLQKMLEP
jgi:hypothetical protein